MREITNLAWPGSPYSSAHRPINRPVHLLTGLSVDHRAWAAVHLPVHRTRVLDPTRTRPGIQAVLLDAQDDLPGWQALDRLLLAGRRQAVVIAGLALPPGLEHATTRLADTGTCAPGLSALLSEWPSPDTAPPAATPTRAHLLELSGADLPGAAADLLARWRLPPNRGSAEDHLSAVVTEAATVAFAASAWIGRYTADEYPSLPRLLDDAIGDQLQFDLSGEGNPIGAENSLR